MKNNAHTSTHKLIGRTSTMSSKDFLVTGNVSTYFHAKWRERLWAVVDIIAPLARCSLYALQCSDEFSAWHVSDQRRVSCQKRIAVVLEQKIEDLQKRQKFPKKNPLPVLKFGSFLQIILQILQSSHIKIYTDRPYWMNYESY